MDWMKNISKVKTEEEENKILLVVGGGRIKRGTKRPQMSFFIPDEMGDEIDKITRGAVVSRYLALIKIGLETLKANGKLVDIDTKDLK